VGFALFVDTVSEPNGDGKLEPDGGDGGGEDVEYGGDDDAENGDDDPEGEEDDEGEEEAYAGVDEVAGDVADGSSLVTEADDHGAEVVYGAHEDGADEDP